MQIVPVVERPYGVKAFWLPLPQEPWPPFVKLSGAAPDTDVALVVYQLCTYGAASEEPMSSSELLAAFPDALPGGLAVLEGDEAVYPSCCCGLEEWKAWMDMLETREAPWLGHDPWPWIELGDNNVTIWSDGGMDHTKGEATPHISTTLEGMAAGLRQVHPILRDFAERMRSVLRRAAVIEADAIAARFIKEFAGPG
jgi:hypothetical protein